MSITNSDPYQYMMTRCGFDNPPIFAMYSLVDDDILSKEECHSMFNCILSCLPCNCGISHIIHACHVHGDTNANVHQWDHHAILFNGIDCCSQCVYYNRWQLRKLVTRLRTHAIWVLSESGLLHDVIGVIAQLLPNDLCYFAQ